MNTKLSWLFLLLVMVGVSSCTEDDNGMKGPFRSWVSVYLNDNTPTFKADRGLYLHVTNKQGDSTFYEVGDIGNVLYTLVDATDSEGYAYQVVMSEFVKATIKPYVDYNNTSYSDTPLANFSGGVISDDCLNVLVNTYDSDELINTIELVRYSNEETHLDTDTLPVIRFRLQHNATSVKGTKSTQAVCFNLSHLKVEYPDVRGFILRFSYRSTGKDQEYDLRYTP